MSEHCSSALCERFFSLSIGRSSARPGAAGLAWKERATGNLDGWGFLVGVALLLGGAEGYSLALHMFGWFCW